MSFGFSIGDIISVSSLAWKLFKSCKDAPGEFKNVAGEVVSLHMVLKETEELVSESNLTSHQTSQLQHLTDGCQNVLQDLTELLKKYQSLGTKTQRTWDRLKWGSEGIANVRTRLISNTTILSAYNTTMVNHSLNVLTVYSLPISSVAQIERQLSQFMEEVRSGKREASVVSDVTTVLDQDEENENWLQIGKELEDVGVSPEAFAQHKDFIVNWFHKAQDQEDGEDEVLKPTGSSLLAQEKTLTDQHHKPTPQDLSLPIRAKSDSLPEATPITTVGDIAGNTLKLLRVAEQDNIDFVDHLLTRGLNVNGSFQKDSMAALNIAAMYGHIGITTRLLSEPNIHVNNKNHLGHTPLSLASCYGHSGVVQLLLEHPDTEVDTIDNEEGQTPLSLAVEQGNTFIASLLLRRGANPNSRDRRGRTALFWASKKERPEEIKLLLDQDSIMPNISDRLGVTPLAQAVESENDLVVRLLLTHPETNMDALDCRLRTPFDRAKRDPDMLPLFEQARARRARSNSASFKVPSPGTTLQLRSSQHITAK